MVGAFVIPAAWYFHRFWTIDDPRRQHPSRASREPSLVIDPKPLVGEREFGVTAIVRGQLGEGEQALRHRLDRISGDLGLDRDRVRRWVLGQTVAWATDKDEVFHDQIEVARSLLQLE